MKINEYGAVFVTPEELFEAIYSGKIDNFNNLFLDKSEVELFNAAVDINKDKFDKLKHYQIPQTDSKSFDQKNQSQWFISEEYQNFPIYQWLLDQCHTELEKRRVEQELELFIQHNMFDLLFYLKYLVDTLRKHNIVWGVGRGSSVASYVLYLIGVHKIDSIKYELDIKEFLK